MGHPSRRTLIIVSGGLLVLALVWQHVQATRLGYEVERSRRQVHFLEEKIGALRMRLETLSSPAELASRARIRLGMLPASPESLRVLGEAPETAPPETLLGRLIPKSWRGLAFPIRT